MRSDAWWLVDHLRRTGGVDEAVVAKVIDHALMNDSQGVTFTVRQYQTILAVLDDPPPGLARLRDALA